MNTKTLYYFVVGVVLATSSFGSASLTAATNDIPSRLQQGLFEEEANHNFPAAIKAYESVISLVDSNRALAATAIFRLGEIYRRQGKTNEASAQYERIVREFSDQEELAKLSQEHLPRSLEATSGSNTTAAELNGLEKQITALKKLSPDEQRILVQQQYPNPVLTSLMQQKSEAEQKLTELNKEFGNAHPEVLKEGAKLETINQQVDAQVAAVLRGLQLRRDSLAASGGVNGSPASAKDSANVNATEADEIKRIRELIKNSPDLINAPQADQQTLLQGAAGKGQLEIVKLLMANGAVVNGIKNGELTPLHYAACNGHKAVVEYLLAHGSKVDAETASGVTALDLALSKGYESVAKTLLDSGAPVETKIRSESSRNWGDLVYSFKGGETPLHIAVLSGYPAMVPMLIKKGADLNALGPHKRTALSYAVETRNEPAVSALLSAGGDPNVGIFPPLYEACLHGFEDLAELLLVKGANPNTNSSGASEDFSYPLQVAIRMTNAELVQLLIKYHANPNQSVQERPIIFDALPSPNILEILLGAGANPNVRNNAHDFRGFSPLEEAVAKNLLVAANLLLTNHAEVNSSDGSGMTALHYAAMESSTNMLELLIANGAEIDSKNLSGDTPLHLASQTLKVANAAVLLTHNADPNLRDKVGRTPLDLAKEAPSHPGFYSVNSLESHQVDSLKYAQGESGELANLLRSKGARDDLPRLDQIALRRSLSSNQKIEFVQTSNNWNNFTLCEFMAHELKLLSTAPSGTWEARSRPYWRDLPFPDLTNTVIHRASSDGKTWTNIQINAAEILYANDSAKNMSLRWGDIVEIPELDHSLSESWDDPAISDSAWKNLRSCLSRQVTIRVSGSNWVVKIPNVESNLDSTRQFAPIPPKRLVPSGSEIPTTRNALPTRLIRSPNQTFSYAPSFMIRSVLDQLKVIRFSSDLTRVEIKRTDSKTGKVRTWVLDCSVADRSPAFWLRDGDMVEIPDRNPSQTADTRKSSEP